MKKTVNINLKFDENNNLIVEASNKKKIKINKRTKTINTKDIYDMLKYDIETEYVFIPKDKKEDVSGLENEHNRLYNYAFDLFTSIIPAVNDKTKKIIEQKNKKVEKNITLVNELFEEDLAKELWIEEELEETDEVESQEVVGNK